MLTNMETLYVLLVTFPVLFSVWQKGSKISFNE